MSSLGLILSNRRYWAPAYAFMCLNLIYGTWAIYIPTIKETIGINKSELGLAIFAMALGNFFILTLAPKINDVLGCGRSTKLGLLALCVFGVGPYLAQSYITLCITLFLVGAAQGFLDVSMNATVSQIEKDDRVTLMAAMHGFFSLGGVAAGLGTFLIPILNAPVIHSLLIVVLITIPNYSLSKHYESVTAEVTKGSKRSSNALKPLILLGFISLIAMGSEGAIVDWSGLYLEEIVKVNPAWIGVGFLVFSITMTLGRFLGDGLSTRLGSEKVLILGILTSIIGYLGVLTADSTISVIGFAIIGAGFSVLVPELFRMAGKQDQIPSSKAIAIVAGFGYSGFLTGPVILGITAETYDLTTSYYGLTSAAIIIGLLSIYLSIKKKRSN
ncbi:MAG: Inner membrane protein YbjJ [Flavobacteriaceae bacterium]|nr:MAG: Inner membrane protein YbjJ [Flavobacteriaceae bacterium]